MYLQNLHTHSTYCDGKDKPEEMILSAIEQGFDSVGFSGHSYMFYSPSHSMSIEGTEEYKREVRALKEKYRDKLDIFCGLEFDMYSEIEMTGYDYVIGAAHYLKIGDEYVGFDRTADVVEGIIRDYFGGDGMKYAKMYYETLSELPKYVKSDILGHIDLICKFAETHNFFDWESKEYNRYLLGAIDALTGKIPFFEVNTGAVARGYRKTPYTTHAMLKELKARGWGATISSDCHDRRYLKQSFGEAAEMLKAAGFKEIYVLKASGFEAVPID
ncbi:MAG: histidinol-phosphatase HisJ family protein [Clostridia bacterium]|nr:histidinol-phosphatase HisJ family protein [Clostridia bacterium]